MKHKKQKTRSHRSIKEYVLPSSFKVGDITFSQDKKTGNFYTSVTSQGIKSTLAVLNACLDQEKSETIDLKDFMTFVSSCEEQRIYLEGVNNIPSKGAALMWVTKNMSFEQEQTPPLKHTEALKPAKRQKKLAPSERVEIPETHKPKRWSERLRVKVALEQSRQTDVLPATPEKLSPKIVPEFFFSEINTIQGEVFSPLGITVPSSPKFFLEEEKYTSPHDGSLSFFTSTSSFSPYFPESSKVSIVFEEEWLQEMDAAEGKENEDPKPSSQAEGWVDSILNSLNGPEGQCL